MSELNAACEVALRNRSFRAARQTDLGFRDLCGMCFPDGELTESLDSLVVADGGSARMIHLEKGATDRQPRKNGNSNYTNYYAILDEADPEEVGL